MRLFVAIELPPPLIAAVEAVSQVLRERISREASRARLTWVTPDRMHVSVRFLGEVAADQGAALTRALTAPLDSPAFTLSIGSAGAFPGRGAPRALWVALAGGDAALRVVAQEVSSRLETAGIPRESRPFSPHLTLARVREPAGLRPASVLREVTAPPHAGGRIDAITLFESRLSPKGPTYTALLRTPLRQG